MRYRKIYDQTKGINCTISIQQPEGGVAEVHAIVQLEPQGDDFQSQSQRIIEAIRMLQADPEMEGMQPVFKRFFMSDAINQKTDLSDGCRCSTLYIGQSPLNGTKIAAWIYYMGPGPEVIYDADEMGSTLVKYKGLTHIWTMSMMCKGGSSYDQSHELIKSYEGLLHSVYNTSMEQNCLRTWFFVKDVDTQYKGLVVARRELFDDMGMNPHTHYIASTGIGGTPSDWRSLVQMSCYTLLGLPSSKWQYLYAPTHLNRTYEYGVTFERGTVVQMRERRRAFISGTASINNKGEVMHVGDIVKQTHRMWENVETLLAEAQMTYDNVMQMIVYLRDPSDYTIVRKMYEARFPNHPWVITLAPVCRPTWLIEMECMAVK